MNQTFPLQGSLRSGGKGGLTLACIQPSQICPKSKENSYIIQALEALSLRAPPGRAY